MNCQSPRWLEVDEEIQPVPCGKCLPCLVNKRIDWAFRLQQEYKACRGSAAFITLTYSAKFVPDDGLNKRHVQLFLKRLRKRIGKKVRYYLVGEYGSKTGRPHYHLLLFNYEESDEKYIRIAWASKKGEPFGLVHIGKVTEASIMYCTKYCIQRSTCTTELSKPFALMSRAYGLGGHYLTDEMVSWHRKGKRNYTLIYGVKGRLPRYYKDKIWPLVKPKGLNWNYEKWSYIRKEIQDEAAQQVIVSELANVEEIRKAGYDDPHKIIAEMREAVISRITEKIAFTQTI